jgi:hypothetical protein
MSTRSIIAATLPNNSIRAVYCHSDGYPSWNGRYLMNYWHSAGRAALVTSLGDMSTLGKVMGKKHDFGWRGKMYSEANHVREQCGWSYDRHDEAEAVVLAEGNYPQAVEEWCLFYGRDRGMDPMEWGTTVQTVPELVEFFEHAYLYLWRHETWWMYVGPLSEHDADDLHERDPQRMSAEWVTLAGILRRDPDMSAYPAPVPYPSPCLPKRSQRLWDAELAADPETPPTRSTGRRATMI